MRLAARQRKRDQFVAAKLICREADLIAKGALGSLQNRIALAYRHP